MKKETLQVSVFFFSTTYVIKRCIRESVYFSFITSEVIDLVYLTTLIIWISRQAPTIISYEMFVVAPGRKPIILKTTYWHSL